MLLSTLIKTRLRASRLCLLICCAAMLALSIIGAIIAPFSINSDHLQGLHDSSPVVAGLIQVALVMLNQLCWSGISIAASIGGIFLYYSMYTMYGTQSAYLYFTLPRSRRDIFHASILTYAIESTILSVTAIVSMLIYGISISAATSESIPDVDYPTPEVTMPEYINSTYVVVLLISILVMIIGMILLSIITPATCCVYGCSFAKKHKLVGTIVASFVVSTIQSAVLTVGLLLPMIIYAIAASDLESEAFAAYMIPFLFFLIGAVTAILAVVMYFMTRSRLENKFDIE